MWAIFAGYVVVGWVCVNLGIWFFYISLGWLIDTTNNPPQEWIDAWAADGAKRVFALMFGWIYATIYFSVWFIPAWLIKVGREFILKQRRTCASSGTPEAGRP